MATNSSLNIPKPKPNYFLSVFSIALVLFLLGFVAALSWHTGKLVNTFKESINIIVELKDSTTTVQSGEIISFLQNNPTILTSSVELINKEQALELMKKEMGDDFLMDEMANPLFDVISFNVKAQYFEPVYLDSLKKGLTAAYPFISSVYYQQTFVQKLTDSIHKIGWGILIASIVFLIIALTIMHSTLKLALYSKRFLIKNMELTGARPGFVRRPFILKGIGSGLISGLLSVIFLGAVIYALYFYMPDIRPIIDWPWLFSLFGIMILAGILITFISTFFIVNRYLRTRTSDLF
jgi:cell division transport system permease protein